MPSIRLPLLFAVLAVPISTAAADDQPAPRTPPAAGRSAPKPRTKPVPVVRDHRTPRVRDHRRSRKRGSRRHLRGY